MKNILYTALIAVMVVGCKDKTEKGNNETIANSGEIASQSVGEGEWKVLFDGTDFDAWKR